MKLSPLSFPAIAIGTHQEQFISVLRVVLEEVDLPVDQEEGDGLLWTAAVWHVLDKQLHLYTVALQCYGDNTYSPTVCMFLATHTQWDMTMTPSFFPPFLPPFSLPDREDCSPAYRQTKYCNPRCACASRVNYGIAHTRETSGKTAARGIKMQERSCSIRCRPY